MRIGDDLAAPSRPAVELRDITKSFGPVHALRNVTASFAAGSVVGLLGENGAGKSTLLRTLSGDYQPDSGTILIDGSPHVFENPGAAHAQGIYVVYQEPEVAPDLSVAENLALGRLPSRHGWVNPRDVVESAHRRLEELGFLGTVDPRARLRDCSPAQRQVVEILKAVRSDLRLLCLDEPTSSLSEDEAERLWALMGRLSAQGTAIAYVSHRMAEIDRLCDSLIVMRDGAVVAQEPVGDLKEREIVALMVGRPLEMVFPERTLTPGDVALSAHGLSAPGVCGVDLEVRYGEILGIGGLVGSGRTELAECLAGVTPVTAGTLRVAGRAMRFRSPAQAHEAGVCLLTEDRRGQGLFMDRSVAENIVLPSLPRHARLGLVDKGWVRSSVSRMVERMRIKTHTTSDPVRNLSGGNQQKVLLARWVELQPRVFILDEPTRGIDIGAKADIYHLLGELADNGVAVVVVSSEMNELLGLADRIVVMREGSVAGELSARTADEQQVLTLALGLMEEAAS